MNDRTILTGLLALAALNACKKPSSEVEASPVYVATRALMVDTSYQKEYVAQIRSVRNIEIRSQEKGFLDEILIDEGRSVKAGQVLFRIAPKVYEA